jgi:hypothetical protein
VSKTISKSLLLPARTAFHSGTERTAVFKKLFAFSAQGGEVPGKLVRFFYRFVAAMGKVVGKFKQVIIPLGGEQHFPSFHRLTPDGAVAVSCRWSRQVTDGNASDKLDSQ